MSEMFVEPCRVDPIKRILAERERQDVKWGKRNHGDLFWLAILMEEVGEASRALILERQDCMKKEIVEVAAVAVAWLECIINREANDD